MIDLRDKTVEQIMLHTKDIYMINAEEIITKELITKIKIKGYSQIPVYSQNKNNVIGVLKAKWYIKDEEADQFINKPVKSLQKLKVPLIVSKVIILFSKFNDFSNF